MNRSTLSRFLLLAAVAGASACIRPNRLQYDYARSWSESFNTQTDLSRASVKDNIPNLSGVEGMALRKAVVEETATAKTATAQVIDQ